MVSAAACFREMFVTFRLEPSQMHRDDDHNQPADHKGLGYVDRAENGHIFKGGKNFCAVD